jgi:Protein of unknown function (DUF3421)
MNADEITTKGVPSGHGSSLFIGGTTYMKKTGPATLEGGNCTFAYFGAAVPVKKCEYLVDQPGKFGWIPSSKGVQEIGSVKYNGIQVGRVFVNGDWRIGKILDVPHSRIYYTNAGKEITATKYEALIYLPDRLVTTTKAPTRTTRTTTTTAAPISKLTIYSFQQVYFNMFTLSKFLLQSKLNFSSLSVIATAQGLTYEEEWAKFKVFQYFLSILHFYKTNFIF